MQTYKHMGFTAGAALHEGPDAMSWFPVGQVFRLIRGHVVSRQEIPCEYLHFSAVKEATDDAASRCRNAIDWCQAREVVRPYVDANGVGWASAECPVCLADHEYSAGAADAGLVNCESCGSTIALQAGTVSSEVEKSKVDRRTSFA